MSLIYHCICLSLSNFSSRLLSIVALHRGLIVAFNHLSSLNQHPSVSFSLKPQLQSSIIHHSFLFSRQCFISKLGDLSLEILLVRGVPFLFYFSLFFAPSIAKWIQLDDDI